MGVGEKSLEGKLLCPVLRDGYTQGLRLRISLVLARFWCHRSIITIADEINVHASFKSYHGYRARCV